MKSVILYVQGGKCDRNSAYWMSISRLLAGRLSEYTNTDRLSDFKKDMFAERIVDDLEERNLIYIGKMCISIVRKSLLREFMDIKKFIDSL